MIAGAALADWLGDRAAQRRSYHSVEASAERWSRHPWMTRLDRAVIELDPRTPEGLLDAARRFIDQAGELEAMMRELLAACREDPFFRPPFQPLLSEVQNSLLLYHHPELSVALGVTGVDLLAAKKSARRGPASVNFTGFHTLMRFVKAGGATFSFWEAPRISDRFVAAEAGTCRVVGRRRIEDGEELVFDGRRQSFVIEHAHGDIVYFQAAARAGAAPVGAEYDSDTGAFVGASSTDEASSRLEMMVSLLRAMDRTDAMPVIAEALASPQFHTRWHVMREMLALDAEGALPALKAMAADDPHPEIRAAALQTLGLFFEGAQAASAPAADGGAVPCRA